MTARVVFSIGFIVSNIIDDAFSTMALWRASTVGISMFQAASDGCPLLPGTRCLMTTSGVANYSVCCWYYSVGYCKPIPISIPKCLLLYRRPILGEDE